MTTKPNEEVLKVLLNEIEDLPPDVALLTTAHLLFNVLTVLKEEGKIIVGPTDIKTWLGQMWDEYLDNFLHPTKEPNQ